MGKSSGGGGVSFPNSFDDFQKIMMAQLFNVITPFGSQIFTGMPGTPEFQGEITLAPEDQALLDQQRALRAMLSNAAMSQFTGGGGSILGMPIGPESFADAAADVERATFERGQALLDPVFQEQQRRQENALVQRGLPRSGEAFTTESDRLSRQQNEALENLALSSVQAGRQEQSRLLQSELARRQGMLGELGFLGLGAPAMPSFPIGTADATGAAGLVAATQGQNAALNAQQQAAGKGGLNNLLGLATLGAFSGGFGGGKGGGKGGVVGGTGPSTFGDMFG